MSRSDELFASLLGGSLRHTADDLAELTGVPTSRGVPLWRALGFPDPGNNPAFAELDRAAIDRVGQLMAAGVLDDVDLLRLARALGSTMARLADWELATFTRLFERSGAEAAHEFFDHVLGYAWRRHLAAAVARSEALSSADEGAARTVGFADMSRFSSLSNSLSEDQLAGLVERFEELAADTITAHRGRVVKMLGDGVLFVSDSPRQGAHTALELIAAIARENDLPVIRVGLATGPVISRLGDVFGPPVNLASRLSNLARSNRVLVDAATADDLGEEFATRALSPRQVRGFGSLMPVTVARR